MIRIEDRGGIQVVVFDQGCRPANPTEIALYAELSDLRARLEKAEPIVAAARNLIEQKGRHNTEIAYKRLSDAIAKERT